MKLSIEVERRLRGEVHVIFEKATAAENLPLLFPGFGVVPGVLEATIDGPTENGAVRIVKTKDGATVRERIVEHLPPSIHRYVLEGLRAPFSWIVESAEGTWRLAQEGDATHFLWTYEFTLTSFLAAPVARLAVSHFRRSMERGLENLAKS